ncbi:MAG: HlyD family secretion protein, partial [candidate division Zixibacteria bacterium]|nr:HlyD family secretion protein [candidate division Zixibacteria bacterium]
IAKETGEMADEKKEEKRQPAAATKLHRKKRVFIPALLMLVVAVLVVFYWYNYLRGYVATDDAVIDSDAVTISSKILGRIVTLDVDEGDSVKVGQLLVQLDDSDLKAQEAQARAALDYVQQNVPVARIALDRARDDFDRASIQYSDHVITREQSDHARKALEMAQAQEAVALSQVRASEAQLTVIETQLTNTSIIAAASGVVARKWVVPGDIVQAGQPIYTLYNLDDVWVTANFEETKLASIHHGDSVEIFVDAFPDHKFAGRVELVGAAAASQFSLIPPNNASGNFTKVTQRVPVKIAFTNLNGGQLALLPGMSVEVKIRVMEK